MDNLNFPRQVTNIQFRVLVVSALAAAQASAFVVPAGCTVYVRAHNGAAAGNAKPVYVSKSPDDALAGSAGCNNIVLAPNTQVAFPVTNTGQLYVAGEVGDGLQISIVGG